VANLDSFNIGYLAKIVKYLKTPCVFLHKGLIVFSAAVLASDSDLRLRLLVFTVPIRESAFDVAEDGIKQIWGDGEAGV